MCMYVYIYVYILYYSTSAEDHASFLALPQDVDKAKPPAAPAAAPPAGACAGSSACSSGHAAATCGGIEDAGLPWMVP